MSGYIIVILLVSLIGSAQTQQDKQDFLMRESMANPVLNLTLAEIKSNLLEAHPDHSLIVLFTSTCTACPAAEDEFASLAASYWQKRRENPSMPLVFWLSISGVYHRDWMKSLGVSKVPVVHFFIKSPVRGIQLGQHNQFPLHAPLTAENMAQWISGALGTMLPPKPERVKYEVVVLPVLVLVLAVVFMKRIKRVLVHPMFWFFVSVAVYFFVMAGTVHNAIHNAPWFYMAPGRAPMFIHPQQRSQFILEGIVIAILFSVGGLSVAMLNELHRLKSSKRWLMGWAGAMLLFLFCANQVLTIYCFKTPWYPFRYYYPTGFMGLPRR